MLLTFLPIKAPKVNLIIYKLERKWKKKLLLTMDTLGYFLMNSKLTSISFFYLVEILLEVVEK